MTSDRLFTDLVCRQSTGCHLGSNCRNRICDLDPTTVVKVLSGTAARLYGLS